MDEQKTINDALRYVLDLLEPINHYPYHNINHTLDVYSRVGHLTDHENVSYEDKTDLLLCALFHDTGFTQQYFNNEQLGANIARKYLENVSWPEDRIVKIERLIMATILFTEARDHLESIIQDADLDNLGRKDCFVKTLLVRKELTSIGHVEMPKSRWMEISYNLLMQYNYRTVTSQSERGEIQNINRREFLKRLPQMIEKSIA